MVLCNPRLLNVLLREVAVPITRELTEVEADDHVLVVVGDEVLHFDPYGGCQHLDGGLLRSHGLEEVLIGVELRQHERPGTSEEQDGLVLVVGV